MTALKQRLFYGEDVEEMSPGQQNPIVRVAAEPLTILLTVGSADDRVMAAEALEVVELPTA